MDAGPIKPPPTAGARLGAGRVYLFLSFAGFAIGANLRVTDPLLPTIAQEFATTVGTAALVAMVFALAHGVLQFFFGPLGDRIGKLPVIAVAALVSGVISAASAFAGSLTALAALRMLSGFATAAIVPLSLAYVGDTTSYEQRHAALARYTGTLMLGLIFGQVLAGLIAEFWGWRAVFLLIGVVFVLAGVGLAFSAGLRGQGNGGDTPASLGYRDMLGLLKRRPVQWVLGSVFLQGMVTFTAAAFVGAHLHDRFGLSLSAIGVLLAIFAGGGLIYALFTLQTVSRLGERGVLAVGGLGFAISFLAMTLATDWHVFPPALFVAGIALMMVHNNFQARATQMAPEARGAALSLFATLIFLGQTIGFAGASLIYDRWGGAPILLIAALVFPAVAFVFRAFVTRPKS
jgi:YNFM family putative membrane transporter